MLVGSKEKASHGFLGICSSIRYYAHMDREAEVKEKIRFILDKSITTYMALCLGVYLIFTISPILSLIAKTPLYHAQSFLGIIGALLLLADVIFDRHIFRSAYVWLLLGIVAAAGLASLRTISYGMKDNLFNLCWATLAFTLFYSYAHRVGLEKISIFLRRCFMIIFPIWTIICLLSIPSFLFQTPYEQLIGPDPLINWTRQGFLEGRLFGMFTGINQSSFISIILLSSAGYYFHISKTLRNKILIAMGMAIILVEQVLSGTRTFQVALSISLFVVVAYCIYRSVTRPSRAIRWGMSMLAGTVTILIFLGAWAGIHTGMSNLSQYTFNETTAEIYEDILLESTDAIQIDIRLEETDPLQEGEDPLQRTDISSENISNNRFTIWGDYFSLWKEIGFIGFSPENYDSAIRSYASDLYIVTEIDKYYPSLKSADNVYHPHNAYIMLYVASGLIGFLLLFTYLILCFRLVIIHIKDKKQVDAAFITLLAIMISSLIFCCFDQGLFFTNTFITCLFWILAGTLTELIKSERQERKERKHLQCPA